MDYGRLGENFTATGVIGEIMQNNSDISLNPLGANELFIKFAHLTPPIGFDSWKIIGPELKGISPLKESFIFSIQVWYSIVISAVLFYFSVNIIKILATKPFCGIRMPWSKNNILFQQIATLLQQGPSVDSHLLERLCWISWIIPSAFLTWACCSSLLSTLTLPLMPRAYETFQDILKATKTKILILDNTPASLEMQNSLDPVVKEVLKLSMKNGLLNRFEEVDMLDVLEQIGKGTMTILLPYDIIMEGISSYGICEAASVLRIPHTTVFKTYYAYPIRRGVDTRIVEAFTSIVYSLVESGIFTQSKEREIAKSRACVPALEAKETIEELSIGKIVISMWILLVGIIMASIAIIWELKVHKPLIKRDYFHNNETRRLPYPSKALRSFH